MQIDKKITVHFIFRLTVDAVNVGTWRTSETFQLNSSKRKKEKERKKPCHIQKKSCFVSFCLQVM